MVNVLKKIAHAIYIGDFGGDMALHSLGFYTKIIFGLLVFISINIQAKDMTMTQHWQESGLRTADLNGFVNVQACHQSKKMFLGCFAALRSLVVDLDLQQKQIKIPLLQVVKPTQTSSPSDNKPYLINIGEEQVDLGIVTDFIANYAGDKASFDFYEQLKIKRSEQEAALFSIFDDKQDNVYANFNSALTSLLVELEAKPKAAMFIANSINAYLAAGIGAHDRLVPRSLFEMGVQADKEAYVGIGANIYKMAEALALIPIYNSPAMKADVQAGDILTHVDSEPIGNDISRAIELLHGQSGTSVSIRILRDGAVFDILVTRQVVEARNVEYYPIEDEGSKVGYIAIKSFMPQNVCLDTYKAIKALKQEQVEAIILDLRNNPGGNTGSAACVTGYFVGYDKEIVTLKGKTELLIERSQSSQATDLPMITLINGRSASAAEFVPAALQYYKRSWLLGSRSFGKGTWQRVRPIGGGKLYAIQTGGMFYAPNGWTNQLKGVEPDIAVPYQPGLSEDELFVPREAEIFSNLVENSQTDISQYQRPAAEVLAVKDCMLSLGRADMRYAKRLEQPQYFDYQLANALDALTCIN